MGSDDVMTTDEREFAENLPYERWMLCRVEESKKLSDVISMPDVPSPFVVVVAVGPDVCTDIKPGDRITYAECLNLPKEMIDRGVSWAKKYRWVHENKFLGRRPRDAAETELKMLKRPPGPDGLSGIVDRAIANLQQRQGFKSAPATR